MLALFLVRCICLVYIAGNVLTDSVSIGIAPIGASVLFGAFVELLEPVR